MFHLITKISWILCNKVSLYRWDKLGTERVSELPRATPWLGDGAKVWALKHFRTFSKQLSFLLTSHGIWNSKDPRSRALIEGEKKWKSRSFHEEASNWPHLLVECSQFPNVLSSHVSFLGVCGGGEEQRLSGGGYQGISLNKNILPKLFSKKTG